MAGIPRSAILLVLVMTCFRIGDARSLLQRSSDCPGEPPEGQWLAAHNFPSAPGNDTLFFQIQAIVTLQKVLDNVYQGSASGIVIDPQLPVLEAGQAAAYGISGIWDEDLCVMSAVMYNFEGGVADPLMLTYDGETLSGPYLNTDYGTVMFSRTGRYDLTPM